jgi:hypothetical protein
VSFRLLLQVIAVVTLLSVEGVAIGIVGLRPTGREKRKAQVQAMPRQRQDMPSQRAS